MASEWSFLAYFQSELKVPSEDIQNETFLGSPSKNAVRETIPEMNGEICQNYVESRRHIFWSLSVTAVYRGYRIRVNHLVID